MRSVTSESLLIIQRLRRWYAVWITLIRTGTPFFFSPLFLNWPVLSIKYSGSFPFSRHTWKENTFIQDWEKQRKKTQYPVRIWSYLLYIIIVISFPLLYHFTKCWIFGLGTLHWVMNEYASFEYDNHLVCLLVPCLSSLSLSSSSLLKSSSLLVVATITHFWGYLWGHVPQTMFTCNTNWALDQSKKPLRLWYTQRRKKIAPIFIHVIIIIIGEHL